MTKKTFAMTMASLLFVLAFPVTVIASGTNESEEEKLFSNIMNSYSGLDGIYLNDATVKLLRSFLAKSNPVDESMGFAGSFSTDVYLLNTNWRIVVKNDSREVFLVHIISKGGRTSTPLLITSGNIDFSLNNSKQKLFVSPDGFTYVLSENKLEKYVFGKTIQKVNLPDSNLLFSNMIANGIVFIQEDSSNLYFLPKGKDELILLGNDYDGRKYGSFYNSFYYINNNSECVHYDLYSGESEIVAENAIDIYISDYVVISFSDGTSTFVSFVDEDGFTVSPYNAE